MDLKSELELRNTKAKLELLEQMYQRSRETPEPEDHELREIEMQSIWRMMTQLKEEIARYEAHHPAARS